VCTPPPDQAIGRDASTQVDLIVVVSITVVVVVVARSRVVVATEVKLVLLGAAVVVVTGPGVDDIVKSKQLMNISGGAVHASLTQTPGAKLCTTVANSSFLKVCVLLPTFRTSLHVFPVFQSQRPTTSPLGHEKSVGTNQWARM